MRTSTTLSSLLMVTALVVVGTVHAVPIEKERGHCLDHQMHASEKTETHVHPAHHDGFEHHASDQKSAPQAEKLLAERATQEPTASDAYIQRVERKARRRGVAVYWVNPPRS